MTIKIPLVWLAVGLFLAAEAPLVYVYHHAPQAWQSTIVFGASVLGGAFALFSYLKGIDEQRRRAADELVQRWNDPSLAGLKEPFREIMERRLDVNTLRRDPNGAAMPPDVLKARSAVVNILNFYEEIAILVRTKGAEEQRLKRFFKSIVCDGYTRLAEWIRHERDFDGRPAYYQELQWLAERWNKTD